MLIGIRSLAVARTNESGQWYMLGLLTFLDPPRPDTLQTILDAQGYGVAVKMITGDHLLIAIETAKRLNLGSNILNAEGLPSLDPKTKLKPLNLASDYGELILTADGFAQVFPEHKYLIVECLRELGYKVGMTGDGVNDAPALKRADVGVAVQVLLYTILLFTYHYSPICYLYECVCVEVQILLTQHHIIKYLI